MARYIDAVSVMRLIPMEEIVARMAIANAPTADVVEVVRCKDCKHHENERIDMVYCPAVLGVGSWVENDWFCKDGERREDDKKRS